MTITWEEVLTNYWVLRDPRNKYFRTVEIKQIISTTGNWYVIEAPILLDIALNLGGIPVAQIEHRNAAITYAEKYYKGAFIYLRLKKLRELIQSVMATRIFKNSLETQMDESNERYVSTIMTGSSLLYGVEKLTIAQVKKLNFLYREYKTVDNNK